MNYLHYDVFTNVPLLGNQLAVFPDGRGLTTEQMQAIAREMNFSESTFVCPPERPDTDVRMRIFTPFVTTKTGGVARASGLGLAVVKAVTEAQGGKVQLESSPRGTTAAISRRDRPSGIVTWTMFGGTPSSSASSTALKVMSSRST